MGLVVVFRQQLRTLLLNVNEISAFGANAKIRKFERSVEAAEAELEDIPKPKPNRELATIPTSDSPQVMAIAGTDFSNISDKDSIAAAIRSLEVLEGAIDRSLNYFGVPTFMDPENTKVRLREVTYDNNWDRYIDLFNSIKRQVTELPALRNTISPSRNIGATSEVDDIARKLSGMIVGAAEALPSLVAISIMSQQLHERDAEQKDPADN
jgi:hypothetical protein